jgi:hypothetical protein
MEAFTYIWHNRTTGKKYVGYHKGNENDGYICSSKNDEFWLDWGNEDMIFEREIIYRGDMKTAFEKEQDLLINLKRDAHLFYNRARQKKFIFTVDVLNKMRGKDRTGNRNGFYNKNHTEESKQKIARRGKENSMYGRSAIAEQNLKWYTNGVDTKMFTEGLQPTGWIPGRNTFVTSINRVCPICGSIFKARGLGKHVKYCGQKIPYGL